MLMILRVPTLGLLASMHFVTTARSYRLPPPFGGPLDPQSQSLWTPPAAIPERHQSYDSSPLSSLVGAARRDKRSPAPRPIDYVPNSPSSSPSRRDLNLVPDTWFIQRAYQGDSFFDAWNFATYPDPTHGQVNYVSREWASSTNMSYINQQGQAVMRVDDWSTLTQGQARNSIRIESTTVYNKGLFILDVEEAPWGCGVWPAWWTVGSNWPWNGEIDIIEGVHDNVHNQVTYHTADGCSLSTPSSATPAPQNYTGWTQTTNCFADVSSNAGCAVIDPSVASYGTQFNVLKGGVFAMMWLDDGIRVWFFHRAAIPVDIINNAPKPSGWGTPTSFLGNACNVDQHFKDHQIVFDITFCGDWAGSSYIDSGCPGTCSDRITDAQNFVNASWTINYLHVFGSPDIGGSASGDATRRLRLVGVRFFVALAALTLGGFLLL